MDRPASMEDVPPELLRECADEFAGMVAERLPVAFELPATLWDVTAAAFLARISAILESLATEVERGQDADAMVMVRVLYDHAATFCWLGIDPDSHIEEWRRWDVWRREKVRNDAAMFGIELSTTDEEDEREPCKPRGLPELADAIDRHWPDRLAAFRSHPKKGDKEVRSFRGLYATVVRRASRMVHATQGGLQRHMRLTPDQVVVTTDERQPEPPDAPELALPMTAFVLLVYRHHFGWPEKQRAQQMTELFLSEPSAG
jgi:hypothetical protein